MLGETVKDIGSLPNEPENACTEVQVFHRQYREK
jgi:hypothetical protein